MRTRFVLVPALAAVALALVFVPSAAAQGEGHGHGHDEHHGHAYGHHDDDDHGPPDVPPGQARKHHRFTMDRATVVTREVLVRHGYEVVRVEVVRGEQVVYYRRGNRGRGKGKGPLEKLIIRPATEHPVFVSVPSPVLVDIRVRLGF